MENKLIFTSDRDYIPLLDHLFGIKKPTEEQLRLAGNLIHLTSSDQERGYMLQQKFGTIKCEECRSVAKMYLKDLKRGDLDVTKS